MFEILITYEFKATLDALPPDMERNNYFLKCRKILHCIESTYKPVVADLFTITTHLNHIWSYMGRNQNTVSMRISQIIVKVAKDSEL